MFCIFQKCPSFIKVKHSCGIESLHSYMIQQRKFSKKILTLKNVCICLASMRRYEEQIRVLQEDLDSEMQMRRRVEHEKQSLQMQIISLSERLTEAESGSESQLDINRYLPHSPYVRRLFVLWTRWMDWINVLFITFFRQLLISESVKLRWLNCVSYWKMFIPNLNTKFINWGRVYFS